MVATDGAPSQLPAYLATKRAWTSLCYEKGTPWDIDTVRKQKLFPLLDKLGIPRCGFHAFRHGNETAMDQENVPMAVRQSWLGHSDARATMMYSHSGSEDGRRIAARLGQLLTLSTTPIMAAGGLEFCAQLCPNRYRDGG
jgi:integrase